MKDFPFCIAGLKLVVTASKEMLEEAMWKFCDKDCQAADIFVEVKDGPWNGDGDSKIIMSTTELVVCEHENYYLSKFQKPDLVECYVNYRSEAKSEIYLTEQGFREVREQSWHGDEMREAIRETFFFHALKWDRLVIHSASFVYKDKVWLISAHSGVGKSTHVSMWHENEYPISDFNGDLAIIYFENNRLVVSSAPWCGTSGLYCNKVAPMGGIIFLERAEENVMSDMKEFDATINMITHCLSPNWNKELVKADLDLVRHFVTMTNYSRLYCRGDREAAFTAKEWIDSLYCN